MLNHLNLGYTGYIRVIRVIRRIRVIRVIRVIRGSGGVSVSELDESEFGRGVEDQVLCDPREVHLSFRV